MKENGAKMIEHVIHSAEGTIRFSGKKLTEEMGRCRLPDGSRAKLKISVYVTANGEGIIKEKVIVGREPHVVVHTVHAGTSPDWNAARQFPQELKLLRRAWAKACEVESSLRPTRQWTLTKGYREIRIRTGPDTSTILRMGELGE